MIKRNKLSIFLLAVVMMLSVYYINMPDSSVGDAPSSSDSVVTRYPDFALSRLELLEEREAQVALFEEVLASAEYSTSEKDIAYTAMQELLGYTEKEVLAEKIVCDLGYVDSFVSYDASTDIVNVEILNYVFEYLAYEELTMKIIEVFGPVTNVRVYTNQQ